MLIPCTVCGLLDNDYRNKDCSYCQFCDAWMCRTDFGDLVRRAVAMYKRKKNKLHKSFEKLRHLKFMGYDDDGFSEVYESAFGGQVINNFIVNPLVFIGAGSANTTGTHVCAVTYSPTAGNHVIVTLWSQTVAASAVADNAAGGSTLYTDTGITPVSAGVFIRQWYSCNVKSGVTTITGTFGTTGSDMAVIVTEYSGGATSSCFDTSSAIHTGNGTIATGNAITPVVGMPEVILGSFFQNTNDTNVFTTSGSYTSRRNQAEIFGNSMNGVTDQLVSSTTGSYTAAAGIGVTANWAGVTTSYK
jgi:hypothetical protein